MTQPVVPGAQDARQLQQLDEVKQKWAEAYALEQAKWDAWTHTKLEEPTIDLSKVVPSAPPPVYDVTEIITPDFAKKLGVDPEKAESGEYLKTGNPIQELYKVPWQNLLQVVSMTGWKAPTVPASDVNTYRVLRSLAMLPKEKRMEGLWQIQQLIYEKGVLERIGDVAIKEVVGQDTYDSWLSMSSSGGLKKLLMQALGSMQDLNESFLDVAFMDKLTGAMAKLGFPLHEVEATAGKLAEDLWKKAPENVRDTMVELTQRAARRKLLGLFGLSSSSWWTSIIENAGGVMGFIAPFGLTSTALKAGKVGIRAGEMILGKAAVRTAEALEKVAGKSERVAKLFQDVGGLAEKAVSAPKVKALLNIARGIGEEAAVGAGYEALLSIEDKHADAGRGALTFSLLHVMSLLTEAMGRKIPERTFWKTFYGTFKGAATGAVLHHLDFHNFDVLWRMLSDPKSVSDPERQAYFQGLVGSMAGMGLADAMQAFNQARDIATLDLAGKTRQFLEATKDEGAKAIIQSLDRLVKFKLVPESSKEWEELDPAIKDKSIIIVQGMRGIPVEAVREGVEPPDPTSPEVQKAFLIDGLRGALKSPDPAVARLWVELMQDIGHKIQAAGDSQAKAAGNIILKLADTVAKLRGLKGISGLFGDGLTWMHKPLSPNEAEVVVSKIASALEPYIGKVGPKENHFAKPPAAETKMEAPEPPEGKGIVQLRLGSDGSREAILNPEGTEGSLTLRFHGNGVDIEYVDQEGQKHVAHGSTYMGAMRAMADQRPSMEPQTLRNLDALQEVLQQDMHQKGWDWLYTGEYQEDPNRYALMAKTDWKTLLQYMTSVPPSERSARFQRIASALQDAGMDLNFLDQVSQSLGEFKDRTVSKYMEGLKETLFQDSLYRAGELVWVGIDAEGKPVVSKRYLKGAAEVGLSKDMPRSLIETTLHEIALERADQRRVPSEPLDLKKVSDWNLYRIEVNPKDPNEFHVEQAGPGKEMKDGVYVALAPIKDGFVERILRYKDGKLVQASAADVVKKGRTISAILRKAANLSWSQSRKREVEGSLTLTKTATKAIKDLKKAGVINDQVEAALKLLALKGKNLDVVVQVLKKIPDVPLVHYGETPTAGEAKALTENVVGYVKGPAGKVPFQATVISLAHGADHIDAMHEFLHAWWFQASEAQRKQALDAVMELPLAQKLAEKGMYPDEIFASVLSIKLRKPNLLTQDFLKKTGIPKDVPQIVEFLDKALRAQDGGISSLDQVYRSILLGEPALPKKKTLGQLVPIKEELPATVTTPEETSKALEEAAKVSEQSPLTEKVIVFQKATKEEPEEITFSKLATSREAAGRYDNETTYLRQILVRRELPSREEIQRDLTSLYYALGNPYRVTSDGMVHLDLPHAFSQPIAKGWKAPEEGLETRVKLGYLLEKAPERVAEYVSMAVPKEAKEAGVSLGEIGDLLNSKTALFVKELSRRLHNKGIKTFLFTSRIDLAQDLIGTPGLHVFERLWPDPFQAYNASISKGFKELYLSDVGAAPLDLTLSLFIEEAKKNGIPDPIRLIKRIKVRPSLKRNQEMFQEMLQVLRRHGIMDPESLMVPPHDVSPQVAASYIQDLGRKTEIPPSPQSWEKWPDPTPEVRPSSTSSSRLARSHESETRLRLSKAAAREILSSIGSKKDSLPPREYVEKLGAHANAVWLNVGAIYKAVREGKDPSSLWFVKGGKILPKDGRSAEILDEAFLWHKGSRKKVIKAIDEFRKEISEPLVDYEKAFEKVIKVLDEWELNRKPPSQKDLVPLGAWAAAGGAQEDGTWGRTPLLALADALRGIVQAYSLVKVDFNLARQLMEEARTILSDPVVSLFESETPDPLYKRTFDAAQGTWAKGEYRLSVEIDPAGLDKVEDVVKDKAVEEIDPATARKTRFLSKWEPYVQDVTEKQAVTQIDLLGWLTEWFAEGEQVVGTNMALTFHDALSLETKAEENHQREFRRVLKDLPKGKLKEEAEAIFMQAVDAGNDKDQFEAAMKQARDFMERNPGKGNLVGAIERYVKLMRRVRNHVLPYTPAMMKLRRHLSAYNIKLAHYRSMVDQRSREVSAAENPDQVQRLERSLKYYKDKLKEVEEKRSEIASTISEYIKNWGSKWYYAHRFERVHPLWEGAGPIKKLWLWAVGVPKTIPLTKAYDEITKFGEQSLAPSSILGRHLRHRKEGKLGYSMDFRKVIPSYLRSIHRVVAYNRAMEVLDARINGHFMPVESFWRQLREGEELIYKGGRWKYIGWHENKKGSPLIVLQSLSVPSDFLEVSPFDRALQAKRGGILDLYGPEAARRVEDYLKRIRGVKAMQSDGIVMESIRGINRRFRSLFYHTLLGLGNFPAATQNFIGGQLMNVIEYGPGYFQSFAKFFKDKEFRAEVSHYMNTFAVAETTLFRREIHETTAGSVKEFLSKLSFFPFSSIEFLNRFTSYVAGFDKAKQEGLSGRAAHLAALRGVSHTQFLFSSAMSPKVFQNEFWKTFLMLWQYGFRFTGRFGKWTTIARKNPEFLFRYIAIAGLSNWVLQRYFGLQAFDAIGSYMDEIPGFKKLGLSIWEKTGWRPQIPGIFPFGLAAPVKVVADMAGATTDTITGQDPMALQKFLQRDIGLLIGTQTKRFFDLLSAEEQDDGSYVIRYAEDLAEFLGLKPRSGAVQKKRESHQDLIFDFFAGSHSTLDETLYNHLKLMGFVADSMRNEAKLYHNLIKRGARLAALGYKIEGAAAIRNGVKSLMEKGMPAPSASYILKYAQLVDAPKDFQALLTLGVPKNKKIQILTSLLHEENVSGHYQHTLEELQVVTKALIGNGEGIDPETARNFVREYRLFQEKVER